MQPRPMTSTAPRNTRSQSTIAVLGTNHEEPTPEMLAAMDAEASKRVFAPLRISEELSGGADAMYLREIASHNLLSSAEEIALAKRMEAGQAAAARLNSPLKRRAMLRSASNSRP